MQVLKLSEEQKAKQIRLHEIEIEKITQKFKDPSDPITTLYSTTSPKKDLIKEWAKHLEVLQQLGAYQEPVNTISTFIKKELVRMGLPESVTHYVHEILPFKYKREDKMNYQSEDLTVSGSTTQNSSDENELKQIRIENEVFKKDIQNTIEFLYFISSVLDKRHFVSLIDQELFSEYHLTLQNTLQRGRIIFNNKKKDQPQAQFLLVQAVVHGNSDYAAGEYMKHIKQLDKLTGKQAVKILRGLATELHPLYDPKNQVEAMQRGFYGKQCDECGSWRVGFIYDDKKKKFRCHCYSCKDWKDAVTENSAESI